MDKQHAVSSNLVPYEGDQPYIFISYSHKDKDRVFPILQFLQENGYRLWVDEGIDPGSEWPEYIAAHLEACAVFIPFISVNSMESDNCRREINYAVSEKKQLVSVFLEECDLKPGMKLQISSYQCLFMYTYASFEAFAAKLLEVKCLLPCKAEDALESYDAPVAAESEKAEIVVVPEKAESLAVESEVIRPKQEKAKKKKFLVAALVGICVLAVAVVLALFVINPTKGMHSDEADSSLASVVTDGADLNGVNHVEIDPSLMYHIVLNPDKDMFLKDFNAALEILEGRLDIFSGDEAYVMEVNGDQVDLYLPKSRFADLGIEQVLQCYLTRATKLYVFDKQAKSNSIIVSQEDLKSVTLHHGKAPGVSTEELQKIGITDDEYPYIEIVLTDFCADMIHDSISTWNSFAFGQDLDNDSYWYYYTYPEGDGKTFYLIDTDEEYFSELVVYNLTHDSLSYGFYFTLDDSETASWENIESADVIGANQCNVNDFSEPTVSFVLHSYETDFTTGELYDIRCSLKERLDALEIPYAFALDVKDNGTDVTAKCPLKHMGEPIMKLLGIYSSSLDIQSGLTAYNLYGGTFSYEEKVGGQYVVVIQTNEYDYDEFRDFSSVAVNGTGQILLTDGEHTPILCGTIDSVIEDGTITFSKICIGEEEPMTANNLWVIKLLDAIYNGTKLPSIFSFESGQLHRGPDGAEVTANDLEIFNTTAETDSVISLVKSSIQSISSKAEVFCYNDKYNGLELRILAHLAVDDTLPQKATELSKAVLESFDFDNSRFESVRIYLINENNDTIERARINFHKSYGNSVLNTAGYVYISGIFCNGRLEAYKEEMRQIVESDEFFTSSLDEWSPWFWDWN